MRQRRGLWVELGLACMLAVVECNILSESVGERTEGRMHLLLQERDERLEEEEEEGEGYRREGPTLHAAPGGRRS